MDTTVTTRLRKANSCEKDKFLLNQEQTISRDMISRDAAMGGSIIRTRSTGSTPTNLKDLDKTQDQSLFTARKRSHHPPVVSPKHELQMKKRKVTQAEPSTARGGLLSQDAVNDAYCWLCHREGKVLCCELCPRVYHMRCLNIDMDPEGEWVCPECQKVMSAECTDTRSKAMSMLTLDVLCSLLKYALHRMRHQGSEPFEQPVDLNAIPSYRDYVFHPMDLQTLEMNIKKKMYGCTEAFLADAKWILHNCIIFNGTHHKLTSSAKMIVKICRHEMSEIEVCPDCYMNSSVKRNEYWFCEPCRNPHPLVWSKLKGYPFWPAKALREIDGQVDVRFFGAHDRSWVPVSQCYMLSKECPTPVRKKTSGFDVAMDELDTHIERLRAKFGHFEYFRFRTPYDEKRVYMQNKLKSNRQMSTGFIKKKLQQSNESKTNPNDCVSPVSQHGSVSRCYKVAFKSSAGRFSASLRQSLKSETSKTLDKGSAMKAASALRSKYSSIKSSCRRNSAKNLSFKGGIPHYKSCSSQSDVDSDSARGVLFGASHKQLATTHDSVVESSVTKPKLTDINVVTKLAEKIKTFGDVDDQSTMETEDATSCDKLVESNFGKKSKMDEGLNSSCTPVTGCEGVSGEDSVVADGQGIGSEQVTGGESCELSTGENQSTVGSVMADGLSVSNEEVRGGEEVEMSRGDAHSPACEVSSTTVMFADGAGKVSHLAGADGKEYLEKLEKTIACCKAKLGITGHEAGGDLPNTSEDEEQYDSAKSNASSDSDSASDSVSGDDNLVNERGVAESDSDRKTSMSEQPATNSAPAEEKSNQPHDITQPHPLSNTNNNAGDVTIDTDQAGIVMPALSKSLTTDSESDSDTGKLVIDCESETHATKTNSDSEKGKTSKCPDDTCCSDKTSEPAVILNVPLPEQAVPSADGSSKSSTSSTLAISALATSQNEATSADLASPPTAEKTNGSEARGASRQLEETMGKYHRALNETTGAIMKDFYNDLIKQGFGKPSSGLSPTELLRLQWNHQREIAEIMHNCDLTLREMRVTMEIENKRVLTEVRKLHRAELEKAVAETKKKQWCAHCGKEAMFYCCWNTSYCDYPCQQADWPQHMNTCTQADNQESTQQAVGGSEQQTANSTQTIQSSTVQPNTAPVRYMTPASQTRPSPTEMRYIAPSAAQTLTSIAQVLPSANMRVQFVQPSTTLISSRGQQLVTPVTNSSVISRPLIRNQPAQLIGQQPIQLQSIQSLVPRQALTSFSLQPRPPRQSVVYPVLTPQQAVLSQQSLLGANLPTYTPPGRY